MPGARSGRRRRAVRDGGGGGGALPASFIHLWVVRVLLLIL